MKVLLIICLIILLSVIVIEIYYVLNIVLPQKTSKLKINFDAKNKKA